MVDQYPGHKTFLKVCHTISLKKIDRADQLFVGTDSSLLNMYGSVERMVQRRLSTQPRLFGTTSPGRTSEPREPVSTSGLEPETSWFRGKCDNHYATKADNTTLMRTLNLRKQLVNIQGINHVRRNSKL